MTLLVVLGWFFALAAACSLLALCAVVAHDVPRITGTVALILTLAALGVAILH
ncbi:MULTISPECIES: hypothetical protein [unclassified Streptomyces]|uniref:hypothetical protein n=1 Tax=unclassified Streptomyces TaxID=2593676 RepID=UPI0035DE4693